MPPCGMAQAQTVSDLVYVLGAWAPQHPEFVVGTNEAGMRLGDATRGAVWARATIGRQQPTVACVPPVLAAEVAGRDAAELVLRDKARWYLSVGVPVVWLLFPEQRQIALVTDADTRRYGLGERLPDDVHLPGLTPPIDELFRQGAPGGG